MFNCDVCLKATGPRIKPVMLTGMADHRVVSYTNKVQEPVEEGSFKKPTFMIKVTTGSEFIREFKVCPGCAGTKPTTYVAPKIEAAVAIIKGMQAYARKSNKKIEDDKVMQRFIEDYKTFPLAVISKALEDVRVVDSKVPGRMAYTIMENVIKRADQASADHGRRPSKRAGADFVEGFSIMKTYEQLGGKL